MVAGVAPLSERSLAIGACDIRGRVAWCLAVVTTLAIAATSAAPELEDAHAAALVGTAVLIWWQARRMAGATSPPHESITWRSLALATQLIAFGLGSEGLVALARFNGVGVPPDVALMVMTVVASGFLYVGFVQWNRFRVHMADPGDWLNGVCAVLVVVSSGLLFLERTGLPIARWPGVVLALWLSQIGLLIVLGGTGASVAALAGLKRDRRIWAITAVLWVAMLGDLATGLLEGSSAAIAALQVTWAMVALSVLAASGLRVIAPAARAATTPTANTVGSVVVLIAGVAVLTGAGASTGRAAALPLGVAAASIIGSALRMVFVYCELAKLADSHEAARTDPLTGTANRRGMADALKAVSTEGVERCLMVIDLDRFKEVNDRFGHLAGDQVLLEVSARLRVALPSHALLARIGGDEFAVLLTGISGYDAETLAAALFRVVREPIVVAGRPTRLSASIGMSTGHGHLDDHELFRRADTAMYVAKRSGGGVSLFDDEADQKARAEQSLLDDLRVALDDAAGADQIVVYFQPQLDLRTGRVVGAEALVRWTHPRWGLLQPGAFIDLVERDGLMAQLTTMVLDQAGAASRRWHRRGHDVPVSVNLSTSCLIHPELLSTIEACLRVHDLPAAALVVEITETTLMSDPELSLTRTREIAERGVGISIDDFGTGYSSLSYLNDLPAVELKLDRSLITGVEQDSRTEAIVAGTVDLAHHLGLRVVAEGVETDATRDRLRALRCDVSQGYLHARPMPLDAFLAWLDDASADPSSAAAPTVRHPASPGVTLTGTGPTTTIGRPR